jgi:type III restriction enzyme
MAGGDFKFKSSYFKDGDDIEVKTKNPVYKGWVVERILKDPLNGSSKVKFSNGVSLTQGESHGIDKESIFREQIRWTIKKHFDKKDKYKKQKIKVLSLFFIDRVANYIEKDSLIRVLFEKIFSEEYKKRYGATPSNISQVHDGYFAQTSKGEYTDSELSMSKNSEAYQKILRDKERLLSFEEPLEFIFSHSALGVGWDNPNVFNICTLNETESLIKKRQEIGRGLRLSVTQDGVRYRDAFDVEEGKEVNLLTVVANQSYYAFAQSYQDELVAEYGEGEKKPELRNARHEPKEIKLKQNVINSDDFQKLWKKISQKTKCKVFFREDSIIEKCIEGLNSIVVPQAVISINLNKIIKLKEKPEEVVQSQNLGQTEAETKSSFAPLNLFEEIAKSTALSIATAMKILEGVENKQMIVRNPVVYLTEAIKRIKRVLNDEMVRLVRYELLDEQYSLSEFEKVVNTYQQNNIVEVNNGLYDNVVCDSDVERNFALDIDEENKVRVFVKLPHWYTVPTPIGSYTPDFALVLEKRSLEVGGTTKYYFVIETKGSREWEALKEDEKMKIECAIKHFEAIGLKEYLAPVENMNTFKSRANEITGENLFN